MQSIYYFFCYFHNAIKNLLDSLNILFQRGFFSILRGLLLILRRVLSILILSLLAMPSVGFSKETEIKGLRIWPSPESTRVVIDLNGPVQYEQKEENGPEGQKRVIILIKNALLKADLSKCKLKNTGIKNIISHLKNKNQLELVLELEKPLKPNSFSLSPNQEYGHRLVIDLEDESAIEAEAASEASDRDRIKSSQINLSQIAQDPIAQTQVVQSQAQPGHLQGEKEAILAMFESDAEPPIQQLKPRHTDTGSQTAKTQAEKKQEAKTQAVKTQVAKILEVKILEGKNSVDSAINLGSMTNPNPLPVTSLTKQKQVFIVAIDAGHGGEDPGAIGRQGTREKDVVLAIAKYLKTMIDQEPGMKGILIRSGDYYVGLKDRMNRARKHKADLFVSVHADAFHDKRAEGASVFTLSEHGASSTAAKWIADRENRSDLIGGVKLSNKNKVLASVLLDLTQSASKEEGLKAAKHILGSLGKVGSLHRGQVEQAGFAVLKAPDVPSMLVETGFISHPATERKLKTAAHQKKIAAAIMGGIRQYANKRSH